MNINKAFLGGTRPLSPDFIRESDTKTVQKVKSAADVAKRAPQDDTARKLAEQTASHFINQPNKNEDTVTLSEEGLKLAYEQDKGRYASELNKELTQRIGPTPLEQLLNS